MPRTSLIEILLGTTALTTEQLTRAEELSAQKGLHLEEVLVQQDDTIPTSKKADERDNSSTNRP